MKFFISSGKKQSVLVKFFNSLLTTGRAGNGFIFLVSSVIHMECVYEKIVVAYEKTDGV